MKINTTIEKEEYISKLDGQIQAINCILNMDSGTVVSDELKKQLKILKTEAEIVLRKLKNNEFEIAIVGLEKAGKSTFANALMENNLLPTKDARCTFTSTQIEYSSDDSAMVSFYTSDEFNKDFKDKLCKLGFPNYERYSFDTIDEKRYLSIYESEVSDEKKRLYGDSIHEDILAIIRNINSLSNLLGIPSISFGADKINSGELATYITDESKARAVKQVIIRSKKLMEMKNAVIFDVPGFNSPTELHKVQTLERMKSADAIIVIANGASPSLTGESLSILRQSDDDGNPLSDKLFVFANKIDQANNIAINIQNTYDEWINKKFVTSLNKHRIIFGSARAHLQESGLDNDDRILKSFKERENELPAGDGIEAIRKELAKYNENERFEVLKRRINRIKEDIFKAFRGICSEKEEFATNRNYSTEQVAMITEQIDDIRPVTEEKLLDLKDKIREYMSKELPLSKQITDYISANITIEKYSISDELANYVRLHTPYIGGHEDVGRIEFTIREMKFKEMYEDFSQNVINIADKHHTEYSFQILDILLDTMGVDTSSPYRNELSELLKNEIVIYRSDLLSSHTNEFYYQSLIERFSRYIYQILITSPYSVERLGEFYDSIDEFYSLSVFYRKPDCKNDLEYIDIAPKNQPLCMMLLFHHYLNATDSIRLLINDISRISGIGEVPEEIFKFAEKAFFSVNGNNNSIIDVITKKFANIADESNNFRINLVRQALSQIVEINQPCSVTDKKAFIQYYERYHSSIRGGELYSIENFRKDFNVDIQILQDVLTNAFVRAISMEKPFIAREIKSIDDIIDYIKSKNFSSFFSKNFYKIKYKETQLLDKHKREQEQNIAIISAINNILDSLAN